MNKNMKKLFNVIMYLSTLNGKSHTKIEKYNIPVQFIINRKNRTKKYNLHFLIKGNIFNQNMLFCSLVHKSLSLIQLYECNSQYEHSICSTSSIDTVLQYALNCDDWNLGASGKTKSVITTDINYLNMEEDEYFQYSLSYDLPEYIEMQKYKICVNVMNEFYEKYLEKHSRQKNEFSRLMFLDCKRIFLKYIIEDDIDIDFNITLQPDYYQLLIYNTNFDFDEFKKIVQG